jgi:hypothetical protein
MLENHREICLLKLYVAVKCAAACAGTTEFVSVTLCKHVFEQKYFPAAALSFRWRRIDGPSSVSEQ